MTKKDRVLQSILKAMNELNQQLPKEQRLEKSEKTVLFGRAGKLDSLGLVNLFVMIEQNLQEEFGVFIDIISNDMEILQSDSRSETIESLANTLSTVIEEKYNG